MEYSENGFALTKRFESCRLKAYQDSGGVWTIGWGHTPATMGQELTQSDADALLVSDIGKVSSAVNRLVSTPLTQNQFDALVDFAFNLGCGALKSSTLLKKFNAGDVQGAAEEFPKWNKCKGKVLAGLTWRRMAERELFLT